jgi:hypothetical protein
MQRRYPMQRISPIILWLLLAATFSVDAVFGYWTKSDRNSGAELEVAFYALMISQLSIVCVWSATRPTKTMATRILPVASVAAQALVIALLDRPSQFQHTLVDGLIYLGTHAAILVAALWVLQRTRFWQRRTGTYHPWRYSLGNLLVLMTILAVLAGLLRVHPIFGDDLWFEIVFMISSVALAIASVFFWSLSWHSVLRLAAVLCFALLLGLVCSLIEIIKSGSTFASLFAFLMIAQFLIQGMVLSMWLGCGPILPDARAAAAR